MKNGLTYFFLILFMMSKIYAQKLSLEDLIKIDTCSFETAKALLIAKNFEFKRSYYVTDSSQVTFVFIAGQSKLDTNKYEAYLSFIKSYKPHSVYLEWLGYDIYDHKVYDAILQDLIKNGFKYSKRQSSKEGKRVYRGLKATVLINDFEDLKNNGAGYSVSVNYYK